MITSPPTITICRNIFDDINTWLDEHNKKELKVVNVFFSSRYYILNYNTTIEFEEVYIPIEDINQISYNKNKAFQQEQINKYNKKKGNKS